MFGLKLGSIAFWSIDRASLSEKSARKRRENALLATSSCRSFGYQINGNKTTQK